jgi:hypothetical protein
MIPAMRRALPVLFVVACGGGGGGGPADPDASAGPDASLIPCNGCTIATLPSDGCDPIAVAGDGTVAWKDEACAPRATQLEGSVARWFELEVDGATRHASGGSQYDGMGFVVSHNESGAFVEDCVGGAVTPLVAGANHYLRRIECSLDAGPFGATGTIRLVVDWFFATGRSHPVYALTYDLGGVAENDYDGDSRAPYGEVGFDGDAGGTVDGVAWGDSYRFESLGTLDKLHGWDYTQPNTVPFAMEWISANDAEMGLVQTETQAQHAAGGYWFYTNWGTRDEDGPMPEDFNWAYQLNQYSFGAGETTSSTRLAWGMNFGAVGQSAYAAIGQDPDNPPAGSPSGWPEQSYATYIVLGTHTDAPVDQVAARVAVEASQVTGIEYDARYGVYRMDAGPTVIHVAGTEPLVAPIVVVHGASADAAIRLAGALQVEGTGVLTSFDAATGDLWISFRSTWLGDVPLDVE